MCVVVGGDAGVGVSAGVGLLLAIGAVGNGGDNMSDYVAYAAAIYHDDIHANDGFAAVTVDPVVTEM